MSEQLIMDAMKVALTAANAHPFFLDEIEPAIQAAQAAGETVPYYTEITVTPRYEESAERVGPFEGASSYRATTRYVSVSRDGARQMRERTITALRWVPLTVVGGQVTTPMSFESGSQIGPDNGQWSGSDDWTVRL